MHNVMVLWGSCSAIVTHWTADQQVKPLNLHVVVCLMKRIMSHTLQICGCIRCPLSSQYVYELWRFRHNYLISLFIVQCTKLKQSKQQIVQ